MHDDNIPTYGTILRPLRTGLHEVALKNGKTVVAHLSKELALAGAEIPAGTRVSLEMTPYDFDQARITGTIE